MKAHIVMLEFASKDEKVKEKLLVNALLLY